MARPTPAGSRVWALAAIGGVLAALATVVALAAGANGPTTQSGSFTGWHVELAGPRGQSGTAPPPWVLASGGARDVVRTGLPDPDIGAILSLWPLLSGTSRADCSAPVGADGPIASHRQRGRAAAIGGSDFAAAGGHAGRPGRPVEHGAAWGHRQSSHRWCRIGHGAGGAEAWWSSGNTPRSALSPVSPIGHYRLQTSGNTREHGSNFRRFRTPGANRQWHNRRGWALTLRGYSPPAGRGRFSDQVSAGRGDFLARTPRWRRSYLSFGS